jgi:thymidine phosphorylase
VSAARKRLVALLASGAPLERFERMIHAQGGDPRVVADPARLPRAKVRVAVVSPRRGFVADVDALELGHVAVALGAGRLRAEDPVDPRVGIELLKKPGDAVERGEPLALLHVMSAGRATPLVTRVEQAFTLASRRPSLRPLVVERIAR